MLSSKPSLTGIGGAGAAQNLVKGPPPSGQSQESETGSLRLGESVEAVRGMDAVRIAPQPPTDDTLHCQILELQVHLQKAEAEKVEFIKQGKHQEMDCLRCTQL